MISPVQRWTVIVLIAALISFVGYTFGSLHHLLAIGLLASLGVIVRIRVDQRPRRPSQKTAVQLADSNGRLRTLLVWGIGITLAVAFASIRVLSYLSLASFNPLEVGADCLAHASLALILFLWFAHKASGHVAMLSLGLIAVMMCVIAGVTGQSLDSQITVALCLCTGYVLASQAIVGGFSDKALSPSRDRRLTPPDANPSSMRIGTILSLLTLSAILITTGAVTRLTGLWLPNVQGIVKSTLDDHLDQAVSQINLSGTRYVNGSTLGSIRSDITNNPDEIALRVFSSSPPGYLAGHAFDFYRQRHWRMASAHDTPVVWDETSMDDTTVFAQGRASTVLQRGDYRRLRRFLLTGVAPETICTIEVCNVPMKGQTIFLPLATQWLEARSGQLTVTHHRSIRHGIDVTNSYVIGVTAEPLPDRLSEQRKQLLLSVPAMVREVAEPLAERVCAEASTPREKAELISRFFAENFSYSIQARMDSRETDPLVFFLRHWHPAHCEFFASATVMLLRCEGIPARYVTGYVVDEKSDQGDFWIARNRDAHAWAEAFDERTQQWLPVESTPGREYRSVSSQNGANTSLFDDDRDAQNRDNRRSWWAVLWVPLGSRGVRDVIFVLFRFAQAPLFLAVSLVLWRRYRNSYQGLAADDISSRRMLHRIDRRMRRVSLVRNSCETMHQFADRIEQSFAVQPETTQSWGKQHADWYRQFAEARYRGQLPTKPLF